MSTQELDDSTSRGRGGGVAPSSSLATRVHSSTSRLCPSGPPVVYSVAFFFCQPPHPGPEGEEPEGDNDPHLS